MDKKREKNRTRNAAARNPNKIETNVAREVTSGRKRKEERIVSKKLIIFIEGYNETSKGGSNNTLTNYTLCKDSYKREWKYLSRSKSEIKLSEAVKNLLYGENTRVYELENKLEKKSYVTTN